MSLQQSELFRSRRSLGHRNHGRVQVIKVGEGAFLPGLFCDPGRFLENTTELHDESRAIHRIDRGHVDRTGERAYGEHRSEQQGEKYGRKQPGTTSHFQSPCVRVNR